MKRTKYKASEVLQLGDQVRASDRFLKDVLSVRAAVEAVCSSLLPRHGNAAQGSGKSELGDAHPSTAQHRGPPRGQRCRASVSGIKERDVAAQVPPTSGIPGVRNRTKGEGGEDYPLNSSVQAAKAAVREDRGSAMSDLASVEGGLEAHCGRETLGGAFATSSNGSVGKGSHGARSKPGRLAQLAKTEGNCGDVEDSFQPAAFAVEGQPDFAAEEPEDGMEYLRRVKWERRRIPATVVAPPREQRERKEHPKKQRQAPVLLGQAARRPLCAGSPYGEHHSEGGENGWGSLDHSTPRTPAERISVEEGSPVPECVRDAQHGTHLNSCASTGTGSCGGTHSQEDGTGGRPPGSDLCDELSPVGGKDNGEREFDGSGSAGEEAEAGGCVQGFVQQSALMPAMEPVACCPAELLPSSDWTVYFRSAFGLFRQLVHKADPHALGNARRHRRAAPQKPRGLPSMSNEAAWRQLAHDRQGLARLIAGLDKVASPTTAPGGGDGHACMAVESVLERVSGRDGRDWADREVTDVNVEAAGAPSSCVVEGRHEGEWGPSAELAFSDSLLGLSSGLAVALGPDGGAVGAAGDWAGHGDGAGAGAGLQPPIHAALPDGVEAGVKSEVGGGRGEVGAGREGNRGEGAVEGGAEGREAACAAAWLAEPAATAMPQFVPMMGDEEDEEEEEAAAAEEEMAEDEEVEGEEAEEREAAWEGDACEEDASMEGCEGSSDAELDNEVDAAIAEMEASLSLLAGLLGGFPHTEEGQEETGTPGEDPQALSWPSEYDAHVADCVWPGQSEVLCGIVALLLRLDYASRVGLLCSHVKWADAKAEGCVLSDLEGLWLLGIAACLDEPINADVASCVRTMLRVCCRKRAEKASLEDEGLPVLNTLVGVAEYFGQIERP